MISTPKITGRSRIEASFEDSDQRYYWVPCPHCSEFQILKFAADPLAEGRAGESRVHLRALQGRDRRTTTSTGCFRGASGGQKRQVPERQLAFTYPACTARSAGSVGRTPRRCSQRRRRIRHCSRCSSTRSWARLGRCKAMRRNGSGSTIAVRTTRSGLFRRADCF